MHTTRREGVGVSGTARRGNTTSVPMIPIRSPSWPLGCSDNVRGTKDGRLMAAPLTNVGSRTGAYGAAEWGLTLTIGIIWGSAFLWIAMGVDHFSPGVVAFGRVALGAGALAMFSRARKRIDRADWSRVLVVAVVGNAAPALLYSTACFTPQRKPPLILPLRAWSRLVSRS